MRKLKKSWGDNPWTLIGLIMLGGLVFLAMYMLMVNMALDKGYTKEEIANIRPLWLTLKLWWETMGDCFKILISRIF